MLTTRRLLPTNPKARAVLTYAGGLVLLLFITQVLMPGSGAGSPRGTPAAILFRGLVTGLVTSLYAVGIVLVYRTLRVINFAQGVIGAVGTQFAVNLIVFTRVPFPIALLLALLVSGVLGMIVGLFMLRFFKASRLFLTVVTIVGSQVLLQTLAFEERLPFFPNFNLRTQVQNDAVAQPDQMFPFRGFSFQVGNFPLKFGFEHLLAIELCVLALIGVGVFLRYTKAGTAVRAMAENPERASLLGIGVAGLSVVVWIVAGVLDGVAGFAARSAAPSVGSGFLALLIPFAAAVVARFNSIPVTVAVAIGLGVLRDAWQHSLDKDIGMFYVAVFVLVLASLMLQRRGFGRSEMGADVGWAGTNEPRPMPRELQSIMGLRVARWSLVAVGLLVVGLFPYVAAVGRVQLAGTIMLYAIGVLSLVVLTGWAGQVSLGQWAMVAVGSVVGGALTASVGLTFWLAVPVASAITAAVSVLVGLPALRIKGLFLLVTTFSFAVVISQVLFDERYFGWLLPKEVERPTFFFLNFEDERSMYYLCLGALVLAIVLVTNLRRSRVGRVLIALRDNEANVQAFGISALRAKLLAFALSGGLAGFAGAMYAHQQRGVSAAAFGASESVLLFLAAVVGGVSSPAGALLGATYYSIVDNFLSGSNQVILNAFFNAGGPLLIVFVAPGGFISLVNAVRDSVLRVIAQRRHIVVPSLFADYDPEIVARRLIPLTPPETSMGLAALPIDDRYVLESELYQGAHAGKVERIGAGDDAAALGAAVRSLTETAELT